ncbi:uncharacterized protein V1516DRAFT_670837 [Lipomyces oligophaga]|uniref:uncharacterized protein n=1 Tax=Lipomyces oligophaga TaxID=45792 RepID=UPI0034CF3605
MALNNLFAILNPDPDQDSDPRDSAVPTSGSAPAGLVKAPGSGGQERSGSPLRSRQSPTIASLLSDEPPIMPAANNPVSVASLIAPNNDDLAGVASPSGPEISAASTPSVSVQTTFMAEKSVSAQFPAPESAPATHSVPASAAKRSLVSALSSEDPIDPNAEPPTVCLHVPLNGKTNVVVNFSKLAEDKYGWASLHPRIAAAAAELYEEENPAGQGGAVDESEDSGGEDSGPGNNSASGNKKVTKRRKTEGKYGRYDVNDPFIDDSELLYEEQAASTKDGFFVFSGPLIADQEQVRIERADGTIKRAGRGRAGRPPGSTRGGRRSAAAIAAAAAATGASTQPALLAAAPAAPVPRKRKIKEIAPAPA